MVRIITRQHCTVLKRWEYKTMFIIDRKMIEVYLHNGETYESLHQGFTNRIATLKRELKSFRDGVRPSYVSAEMGNTMANIYNYEQAIELVEEMKNEIHDNS